MARTMLGEAPQQRRANGARNDVAHSTAKGQDAVDHLGALFAESTTHTSPEGDEAASEAAKYQREEDQLNQ